MGTIVVGSDFHDAIQFLVGAVGVVQPQTGLAELVMRLGESGVNLNRVGILNCGLVVLALGEIFFATGEVFLLANVWIPRAAGAPGREKSAEDQHAECNRAIHKSSPGSSEEGQTDFPCFI